MRVGGMAQHRLKDRSGVVTVTAVTNVQYHQHKRALSHYFNPIVYKPGYPL
jgi:hypothetical protein